MFTIINLGLFLQRTIDFADSFIQFPVKKAQNLKSAPFRRLAKKINFIIKLLAIY